MNHVAGVVVAVMWLLWLGYWWYSSRDTKETVRSESWQSRASYIAPIFVAGYLISLTRLPFSHVSVRVYEPGIVADVAQVACVAAGLGFAVWARRCLGRNWSGTVTTKDDHELVRVGPYRIVRHPIYTGIVVAFIGMTVGQGTWTAALAVVLATAAFLRKIGLEEQFMGEQFGEQYEQFRRDVPALIPRLWRR